jgi:hypothetical protein
MNAYCKAVRAYKETRIIRVSLYAAFVAVLYQQSQKGNFTNSAVFYKT